MNVRRLSPLGVAVVGWTIIVVIFLAACYFLLMPSCYGVAGCDDHLETPLR